MILPLFKECLVNEELDWFISNEQVNQMTDSFYDGITQPRPQRFFSLLREKKPCERGWELCKKPSIYYFTRVGIPEGGT